MRAKKVFQNPKLTSLEHEKVEFKYSKEELIKILIAVIRDSDTLDKVRINSLRTLYKYDKSTTITELNKMMEEALNNNDRVNVASLLLKAHELEGGLDDE